MDFNQLKDLKSTWGENRTIVPEWVEGQSFYVVSDELLKQLINEINESRLLREQIAEKVRGMVGRTFDHYPNGATGVYFGKDEPFLLRSEVLAIIEGVE